MSVLSYDLSSLPLELWQNHIIPALNKNSLLALNGTCNNFRNGHQLFLHTAWKTSIDTARISLYRVIVYHCEIPSYMKNIIVDIFSVIETGIPQILYYYKETKKRWQRLLFHKVAECFGLVSRTIDTD